jgi:regulator of protease activity HflC (stomatin/prohibitin superfamily)
LGEKKVSTEQEDFLWSQLAGKAQEKIAQARAYRREVVESAKANAAYLQAILPEYRERPELVLHNLYADAIERIFGSVDEKVVVDNPTSKEVRIQFGRNPAIAPASEEKKEGSNTKQ